MRSIGLPLVRLFCIAVCFGLTITARAAEPMPPGLVAWWPADANADDIAGGHNGTLMNGASFAPDRFNNPDRAFKFDGVDDYIEVPPSSAIYGGPTAPMTVGLWIFRTRNDSPEHILGIRNDCGSDSDFQLAGYPISLGGMAGSGINSGINLPLYTWTHITVTYNGAGTFRAYKNGVLVAQDDRGTTLGPISNSSFRIGNSGNCRAFSGMLDDIQLYGRALSDEEVQGMVGSLQCAQEQTGPLQTQIANLQQQVTTLQAEIHSLRAQIAALDAQAAEMQAQIATLESRVASLEAQLAQLYDFANNLVALLQANFRQEFNDPAFAVPGADPMKQLQNIVYAVINLNKGHKTGVYTNLGSRRGGPHAPGAR